MELDDEEMERQMFQPQVRVDILEQRCEYYKKELDNAYNLLLKQNNN